MKKPGTPFPTTGYYGPSYFCNRQDEIDRLIQNFESGISTTLLSIRRLGKTGLIHHVKNSLKKDQTGIYLDIQATENLTDFLDTFATSILNSISYQSTFGNKVWNLVKSLRPTLTFDHLTGLPKATFDTTPNDAKQSIEVVLRMLNDYPNPVLIAIDEFQQITEYPEGSPDGWLRSIYQQLQNVNFIFSGSRQHLMMDLFANPSKAFYRSTSVMKLDKISVEDYSAFILKKFKNASRPISREVIEEMLEWTERYTYYVQFLCSRVYMSRDQKITGETWQTEAYKILKEQEPVFYNYRQLLTKAQWLLLKAIAMEKTVYQPTAQAFIAKFNLGSSASVLRSLNSLLKNEMVYYDYDENGDKYYKVYDLLLKKWMQKTYG